MIKIEVGKNEKHTVEFSYDTTWGKAKILIDGEVYQTSRIITVGFTPFSFQVGDKEKHEVRIELNNDKFFALTGSGVKFFVDNKLVKEDKVKGSPIPFIFLVILILVFLFFLLQNF